MTFNEVRFAEWWQRPENHLILLNIDLDDRVVLTCVLCDAESRFDVVDLDNIGSSVTFLHASSC